MLLALVTQTSFICRYHPIYITNQAHPSYNRVSLSSSQHDNWINLLRSLSVLVYKYSVCTRVLLSYYSVCVCVRRIDPSAYHVFHPSITQEGHLWDLSANHNHWARLTWTTQSCITVGNEKEEWKRKRAKGSCGRKIAEEAIRQPIISYGGEKSSTDLEGVWNKRRP